MKNVMTVFGVSIILAASLWEPGRAAAGHDYAKGNVNYFGNDVDFSARSNYNGTDAQGRFRYETSTGTVYEGTVTCLQVIAETATLAGYFTSIRNPTGFAAQGFVVNVFDSGKFNQAPDTIDVIFMSTPQGPPSCPAAAPGIGTALEGEIVVYDSLN
jgi:hypothetical protein